jgi:enoyl-CoA hydratase/carnithine racemase
VGAQRAAELLLTGRRFDGREAARIGVALEAVGADEVLPRAQALAAKMANNAPLAVRALKATLAPDAAALRAALENEAFRQAESYGSADLGEGLAAAVERRAAVFSGR